MMLLLVYPFYQVLFHVASKHFRYELAVLLLLPVIKSTMKNVVSYTIAPMEDLVPESVTFTVDFFNAVYLATSMQNTTSTITIVIIMTVDLLQTAIILQDLYRRILTRLQEVSDVSSTQSSVLGAALSICSNQDKFKQQKCTSIRLRSCLPHRLSDSGKTHLQELQKCPNLKPADGSFLVSSVNTTSHIPFTTRCLPTTIKASNTKCASVYPLRPLVTSIPNSEPPSDVLNETLGLLFTTECVILSEYLEAVIPVLYASFMLVMVQLPNAQYHSGLAGVDSHYVGDRVQTIFIYVLLELASLMSLAIMLKRRGGLNVLHQLAFILETQRSLVQGKLLLWMLMVMGFRVVHFGKLQLRWHAL